MTLSSVRFPVRAGKPRTAGGYTMISDHGPVQTGWMGRAGLRDLLEVAGPIVDFVKIRADLHVLAPAAWLQDRLALYREHGVFAYPGGVLMELALGQGRADELLDELGPLGYSGLEISENYVTFTDSQRLDLVARARARGLAVVYELGRKEAAGKPIEAARTLEQVAALTEAGARLVVLERDELELLRAMSVEDLDRIVRGGGGRLALEAGPDRFPDLPVWLIERYGPDVSLANLQAGQVLPVERYRMGLDRAVGYRYLVDQVKEFTYG